MQFLNNTSDKDRELNERIRAASIEKADYYANMSDEEYRKIEDEACSGATNDIAASHASRFSNLDRLLEERDRRDQLDFEAKKAAALKQLEDYQC